ncbi:conserved protein of unknown function [Xenorhabdus poinarii G6]|uniref:Uncharacterized protein n=1 Tax=Xenorhabdus poinarii G6 TaxID=1354304 RepID=A0A068QZG7_9GAMM|nr:conserved protein of unknown function [Xenorhabdus poinarii G6]
MLKFLTTNLAVNAIVSIMRDDLPGENMKNCAVKAMTQHQANATLSAGNVGTLFFPLFSIEHLKKPLN